MKKIILFLSFLCSLSGSLAAQTTTDALDNIISSAETIVESAEDGQTTLYSFTVNYFYYNNPSYITTYMNQIAIAMEGVEEYADEVLYYISVVNQLDPSLDTSGIGSYAVTIEPNEDLVLNLSNNLQDAVNRGRTNKVSQLVQEIGNVLNDIIIAAEEANYEAYQLLQTVNSSYNVRIELVDENTGNPVDPTTLPGYAATNLDTNEIYYPDYYDYNTFEGLPAGTYRFDSYNGYFDGSSSEIVTLSQDLVGPDGYIVVTLQYWSE